MRKWTAAAVIVALGALVVSTGATAKAPERGVRDFDPI